MAEFGTIGTVDDIKKQLIEANKTYEGLKTWEQLYGSVSLMGKQAESALTYDYAKAMSEAYASSLQSEAGIMSSNLGQGFKQRELETNQSILEEAFASYQQNYLEGLQSVAESTAKAEAGVTSELETQASNTEALNASVYNYLEYVFKTKPDLFKELNWEEYLNITPRLDADGKEILDDDGNIVYDKSLKSWQELTTAKLDDNNEYTSLVDEQGYLTVKGVDFYDKVMNQILTGKEGVSTYQSWLRETNPELYNWSQTYNPYDYNSYMDPNTGEIKNTNIGSFRTLVGLTSGDQTYAFVERFGGLTEKELNTKFESFKADFKNINTKDPEKYVKSLNEITEDIKDLTRTMGIESEIEEAVGGWDNLTNILNEYVTNAQNIEDSLRKEHLKQTAKIAAGTALTAKAASLIPLIGGFAAGLVTVVGAGVEIGVSASYQEAINNVNKQAIEDAKNAYANMIFGFTNYAQQMRREKQKNYKTNNK